MLITLFNSLKTNTQGILYAILASLLYAFLPVFTKKMLVTGMSPENLLFWRFLGASLFGISFLTKDFFRLLKIEWIKICLVSFYFIISSYYYVISAEKIGIGLSISVLFTYPAVLVFINRVFLKTNITGTQYWSVLLAILSVYLFTLGEFSSEDILLQGVIYALIASVGYAMYIYGTKEFLMKPMELTFCVCFLSGVFFAITSGFGGDFQFLTYEMLWDEIILSSVCTIGPLYYFIKAVQKIGTVKTSLISAVEPAFTVFLGMLFFDEKLSLMQWTGFIALSIMLYLSMMPQRSKINLL
ncbi:MAG: hypothetical protein C0432_05315 [Candidatus Puniceispirillum sp.]|nr:hypothetical protein [Candidatus Pelagibacter sp.]MBA4283694.1 hypothetical protein [Candidatus Puniceispirillum sp.]